MKAFKAFNTDFTCLEFQFEVGKTYIHEGDVEICKSGFHACVNPLDVLNYYSLVGDDGITPKFAEVELGGDISKTSDGDSKVAAGSIEIKRELNLGGFIGVAVGFMMESAASGNDSNLAASGNESKLAASGDESKLAASGYYSNLAASGNYSNLAASGYASNLAASGYASNLAATGDDSKLAASGDASRLAASGDDSVVAGIGIGSTASCGENGMIILVYVDVNGRYRSATAYAGEDGIKPNVTYRVDNTGTFIKVA